MKSEVLAGLMSVVTAAAGFLGMPLDEADSPEQDVTSGPGYEFGTAHEHAQFFLNVNGSEENFTQRRYQLRSSYVHLENFKPHIVHKHSENVTWSYFLETINVNVSEDCVEFKGKRACGNLSATLKGEEIESLDVEIEQGDNLALILPGNGTIKEKYAEKELPEAYRKQVETRTV